MSHVNHIAPGGPQVVEQTTIKKRRLTQVATIHQSSPNRPAFVLRRALSRSSTEPSDRMGKITDTTTSPVVINEGVLVLSISHKNQSQKNEYRCVRDVFVVRLPFLRPVFFLSSSVPEPEASDQMPHGKASNMWSALATRDHRRAAKGAGRVCLCDQPDMSFCQGDFCYGIKYLRALSKHLVAVHGGGLTGQRRYVVSCFTPYADTSRGSFKGSIQPREESGNPLPPSGVSPT